MKLNNRITGNVLVYGNPSLFTNKTIFGGTNLCIGKIIYSLVFTHTRNPFYCVPIIFDAINYKYISTTPMKIKTPFEINLLKTELFSIHTISKCQDKYELSVCHQDFYSIKYEISIDKVNRLFTNLLNYKKWCFMRASDNKNFPSIEYIKDIMPIKYLPYSKDISVKLRDYKNNKVGLMNYLLQKVVNILDENNIPYYLDCGTLLGCIRDNEIMEKDSDVDITIHLRIGIN